MKPTTEELNPRTTEALRNAESIQEQLKELTVIAEALVEQLSLASDQAREERSDG